MRYLTISNMGRRGRALLAVAMATVALAALLSVWGSLPAAEARGPAAANTGSSNLTLSSSDVYTIFLPIVFKSDIVFFDDFSDSSSGWPHRVEFEDCYYEYRSGRYRVTASGVGQRCIIPNLKADPYLRNGTFEVKVRRISNDNRKLRYGFLFNAGKNATEDHWALEVYPFAYCGDGDEKGDFWLVALEDGDNEFFRSECTDAIDVDRDDWNWLRVIRNGSNIQVWIKKQEGAAAWRKKGEWNSSILANQGYFDLQVISISSDEVTVEYEYVLLRRSTSAP
jgi:hypothetical protein